MGFESQQSNEAPKKLSYEEVQKIAAFINDSRLDVVSDREYFILHLKDRDRYIPKRNSIQVNLGEGIKKLKPESLISLFLAREEE